MITMRIALCAFLVIVGTLSGGSIASAETESDTTTQAETYSAKSSAGHNNVRLNKSNFTGEDIPVDLHWQSCFTEFGPDFECATAELPLDYDRPNGKKISVALTRLPASGQKQGSLFLNPGGPGGSGIEFVTAIGGALFTPEVRSAYDLVGFDPRGISLSTPLLCFDSLDEAFESTAPFAFPTTKAERRILNKSNRVLQRQCRAQGGDIQSHMSTANVARDLEVLRAAVGDKQLNFYGLSYGSIVGQVYAGLFPDNVGRVIIDGVLDVRDWVGTPNRNRWSKSTLNDRIRSDLGAEDTFAEALRLCEEAGPENCPLAPEAEARANGVLDQLRAAPLELTDPETGEVITITYANTIGTILGPLYSQDAWPAVAEFLALVEFLLANPEPPADAGPGSEEVVAMMAKLQAYAAETPEIPAYPNFIEGFPGVACVDTSNPRPFSRWVASAANATKESPNFGELWTWGTSVCNRWPAFDRDRFVGPFGAETATPLLVMTTRFDPATSFEQAVSAASHLPGSSLVTVNGGGHTTLFTSACADAIVADFLLNGELAKSGTVCEPNVSNPFLVPIAPDDAEARASVLAQTWRPSAYQR